LLAALLRDRRAVGVAQARGRLNQRVENGLKVEGRTANDLENVGRRGLLLERLRQLFRARLHLLEQPHVFDRDHRLIGEGLQQRDLLVGERPDLGPADCEHADRLVLELGRQLVASSRQNQACRILMSIPGVGAITATSFATAIEDPDNFKKSRAVGAWLGLTTRRYQSGEVDYDGHISRRGDRHLRGLLYEAAAAILTRSSADSGLRSWGLKLKERVGFKRAAVAVARKLAVTMHAMLKTGTFFDRTLGAAA